jgi:hypothetical protein
LGLPEKVVREQQFLIFFAQMAKQSLKMVKVILQPNLNILFLLLIFGCFDVDEYAAL